jgi:hypothetical protein
MSALAIVSNEVPFYLRSTVAGRDRWELPVLFNDRRRAAAIQMILRTEPGIRKVVANHLTGRVLIEYLPGQLNKPVETLLRRAVAFGPMLTIEFAEPPLESTRKGRAVWSSLGAFASAELGCLLFKLMFFSIGCPTLGIAAAVVFTAAAVSKSCRGLSCAAEPVGGVILDEPGRVSDYQNRA